MRVEEKKEQYLAQKDKDNKKRGPGQYYDPVKQSDFKAANKPEYLQFFGSTQERFKQN